MIKAPKGFAKNYFSLAAIQATVSTQILRSQCCAIKNSLLTTTAYSDEEESPPLLEEILMSLELQTSEFDSQIIFTPP